MAPRRVSTAANTPSGTTTCNKSPSESNARNCESPTGAPRDQAEDKTCKQCKAYPMSIRQEAAVHILHLVHLIQELSRESGYSLRSRRNLSWAAQDILRKLGMDSIAFDTTNKCMAEELLVEWRSEKTISDLRDDSKLVTSRIEALSTQLNSNKRKRDETESFEGLEGLEEALDTMQKKIKKFKTQRCAPQPVDP